MKFRELITENKKPLVENAETRWRTFKATQKQSQLSGTEVQLLSLGVTNVVNLYSQTKVGLAQKAMMVK